MRRTIAACLFLAGVYLGCNVATSSLLDTGVGGSGGFTQIIHTYNTGSAATETVPTGATTVQIEGYGPGGNGFLAGVSTCHGGSGGGGGYVKRTITLISSDWGKTMAYTVGTVSGTNTSITTVNLSAGSASAPTANSGTNATSGTVNGTGGAASNGTTNTTGGAGTDAFTLAGGGNGAGPAGGAGGSLGVNGFVNGGGGGGDDNNVNCTGAGATAGTGARGQVIFTYN